MNFSFVFTKFSTWTKETLIFYWRYYLFADVADHAVILTGIVIEVVVVVPVNFVVVRLITSTWGRGVSGITCKPEAKMNGQLFTVSPRYVRTVQYTFLVLLRQFET